MALDLNAIALVLLVAAVANIALIALAVIVPRVRRSRQRDEIRSASTGGLGGRPLSGVLGGPDVRGRSFITSTGLARPGTDGPGSGASEATARPLPALPDRPVASSDPLTALLTTSAWATILTDEDARVRRYRRPATVVLLELDGLERLMERLGPDAAERLVPAVADTLHRHAREADHVARLGPGRFGVLLPETDEIQAINYIERVRRACDLWLESGAIALRLAIGWASTSGDDGLIEAQRVANDRMYGELRRGSRRAADLARTPLVDESGVARSA
jgi:diguanylate cyclase (GGDEF)-like protein